MGPRPAPSPPGNLYQRPGAYQAPEGGSTAPKKSKSKSGEGANDHVVLIRLSEPLYKKVRAISEARKQPVSDMARAFFVWLVGRETSSEMPEYGVNVREERAITKMRGHFEEE